MYLKHCCTCQNGATFEAQERAYLETLRVLLLLLVYYAQSKVNLIGLFEVWFHAHDLGKGLFGVLEGAVTIVENANAVPQFWLL